MDQSIYFIQRELKRQYIFETVVFFVFLLELQSVFLMSQVKILKIIINHEKCNNIWFGHYRNLCIKHSGVFKRSKDDVFLKLKVCWEQIVLWIRITDLLNVNSLVVLYITQSCFFAQKTNLT